MSAAVREAIDSCALSFTAGFVDTCVFVGLFGLFTAHVTGNFVLVGAELVHRGGDSDVLPKLLALPTFVLAVVATVKARERLQRAGWRPIAPLLGVEALLLLASVLVGFWAGAPTGAGDATALAIGTLAAAAMGLQNALMRTELPHLPSTTVMTVNVTQATIDAVGLLRGPGASPEEQQGHAQMRRRFGRMWPPVVAFTLGAAAGAGGFAWIGLDALLVPAALCVLLAAHFARAAR